jgi:hypothetical protein
MDMTECYKLIDVVCGGHKLQARPVDWDRQDVDGFGNDRKGEPVNAIGFHTTCPRCGNLIDFRRSTLYVGTDETENNIKCESCGCGTDFSKLQNEESGKETVERKIEVPILTAKKLVFRDPIADGLFDEEVDLNLLAKLDSTESN